MCLATQSASDVLESSISRTIIEQTPTKVFFPNAEASAAEYMDGFGHQVGPLRVDSYINVLAPVAVRPAIECALLHHGKVVRN